MAPFWEIRGGSKDHPTAETLVPVAPSTARVGGAEESGRPNSQRWQGENRAKVAQGRKASGQGKGERGSTQRSGHRQGGKGSQTGKVQGIKTYFEAKAGGKGTQTDKV